MLKSTFLFHFVGAAPLGKVADSAKNALKGVQSWQIAVGCCMLAG